MSAVLVLNADCGPLHRVSLRHAIRMLFREVAVVHEAEPDRQIGIYPIPTVVRLVSYVVTRWRHSRGPAWSRVCSSIAPSRRSPIRPCTRWSKTTRSMSRFALLTRWPADQGSRHERLRNPR